MDLVQALTWSDAQLTDLKIPHALIGGMALSEYGYGRGTQDVDWLIPGEFSNIVISSFSNHGFSIFHQSEDVLQLTGAAEIDFLLARRPISRTMIESAHYSSHLKMKVVLPEDLIGLKIQAYSNLPSRRSKDLSDIQELVERCPDLDWVKIKFYADHFGEWATLENLKRLS
ncbi:MAG: hypothetical protein KGP28_10455 [Bdellovibrionales bacterium]|nr:hypothetical protein [Bdellovibrionales bacterium]